MGKPPRLALFGPAFHISRMEKDKSKRPWSGFGYLVISVIAILVAYYIVLPIGQQVVGVFQRLVEAFQNNR